MLFDPLSIGFRIDPKTSRILSESEFFLHKEDNYMATASYTHFSSVIGFNAGDGSFTSVGTPTATAISIDEDHTNVDGNATLEAADGDVETTATSLTYTGFTILGQPVMDDGGGNFLVIHNNDQNYALASSPASADANYVLCFVTGTQITTPEGQLSVEQLKIGSDVVTADGDVEKVKFIHKMSVDSVHTFSPVDQLLPVTIKKDALGNGIPSADLSVSPDHALYVDGTLVIAAALVNGFSISQASEFTGSFDYYHIELENHELILANGTQAETFIDNVDREKFDNYAEYQALYGEQSVMQELDYPRAKSYRQIPKALKDKLAARCEKLYPESAKRVA